MNTELITHTIIQFIKHTYFGKFDTLQFIERYMKSNVNDKEMVRSDFKKFYNGFHDDIDYLLFSVDKEIESGITYNEIGRNFE